MRVWPPVVFGVLACHAGSPAPVALAPGTYRLADAQSFNRAGIIPGEGTVLRSVTAHLAANQTLSACAVVAFADSAMVIDTVRVVGQWQVSLDSLHMAYQWTIPGISPMVHWDSLAGAIGSKGFVLPRFALVASPDNLGLSFERDSGRGLTCACSVQPRPCTSCDGYHIESADCRPSANR